MIGPFGKFADLGIVDRALVSIADAPSQDAMNRTAAKFMAAIGLEKQREDFFGQHMAISRNGEQLRIARSFLYSLVALDEVDEGVLAHIEAIFKHGPGAVWFTSDPVHLIREGSRVSSESVKGDPVRYFLLRTFYAHEAQAVPA